jgi:hypothetical protein
MANRVFSVAAVALGASALMSSLEATPAAAWTHHRDVRVTATRPLTTLRSFGTPSTATAILSLCTTTIRHTTTDTDLTQ